MSTTRKLEIQAQALKLTQQCLYPRSHIPSPSFWFFNGGRKEKGEGRKGVYPGPHQSLSEPQQKVQHMDF